MSWMGDRAESKRKEETMSKISQAIKDTSPKKKRNASRTILIDFIHMPDAWNWIERQATVHGCSKTAYLRGLIELDRKDNGGK
jgi:hypothetical protein